MNQQLVISTQACDRCDQAVWPDDRFCCHCGAALTPHVADTFHGELICQSPAAPGPPPGPAGISTILNHRGAVWCLLLAVGPLGLPLLWFSPRFSKWSKALITLLVFAITVLLPLLGAYYFLDVLLEPLLKAFGNQGGR